MHAVRLSLLAGPGSAVGRPATIKTSVLVSITPKLDRPKWLRLHAVCESAACPTWASAGTTGRGAPFCTAQNPQRRVQRGECTRHTPGSCEPAGNGS